MPVGGRRPQFREPEDEDFGIKLSAHKHSGMVKSRHTLNAVAILLALFLPWLLFCCLFAAMSFRMHYENPAGAMGVTVCGAGSA